MRIIVDSLIDDLCIQVEKMPGQRSSFNNGFRFDDIGTATLSAFSMQSPSLPDHQRKFRNRLYSD